MAEVLGTFEQAVLLAIVKLPNDSYGRSILRSVKQALQREVAAGAIYATLDRLEQRGLLASQLEEGTAARGGRARRFYRLTAAGADALNECKGALDRIWRGAKWPVEALG